MDTFSKKLEIHYHFDDQSHSMDAFVRNKCEHELLLILSEIAIVLDPDLKIDTEALIEGGLKQRFKFITKNKFLQGVIAGVLISVISHYLTSDKELSRLQKEELRLRIEKLKIELNKEQMISTVNIDQAVSFLNNDYKIVKRKSNYYKNLYNYRKVTHVSASILDEEDPSAETKTIINRSEFENFILESDELEPLIDENAVIEIISPVLKVGKYKWKGIYTQTDEIINFTMKDKQFKDEVIRNGVPFKNGTCIDCTLEISRNLDEIGEIKITGFSVLLVKYIHDDIIKIETPQGKKHREKKDADSQQYKLYGDNQNE